MAILSGKIAGAILLASLACSQTLSFVDSQNQTITNGHLIPRNIGSNDVQGIVVCAGEGELFLEMLTMVEHVRYALLSQLPIAIAHCNELTEESILIASSIPDVRVLNLCAGRHSFAKSLRSRLTGFFCKPAALLQSPFQHTILVDTDVIFFKRPERLFKTPQYLVTGTLFFRDRWTQTASKISLTEGTGSASYALEFLHSAVEALNQHNKKGNRHQFSPIMDFSPSNLSLSNAFWRHLASKGGFTPDHWQVELSKICEVIIIANIFFPA